MRSVKRAVAVVLLFTVYPLHATATYAIVFLGLLFQKLSDGCDRLVMEFGTD